MKGFSLIRWMPKIVRNGIAWSCEYLSQNAYCCHLQHKNIRFLLTDQRNRERDSSRQVVRGPLLV
jgi:hypothetical protein